MKHLHLTVITLFTLLLASCGMQRTNCPDLSARHHISKPHYAHSARHSAKSKKKQEQVRESSSPGETLTASSGTGITLPKRRLMEIALPAGYNQQINEVGLNNVNTELSKYSKYMRVEQRGDKAFVKLSPKEMFKVARKAMRIAASPPPAAKKDYYYYGVIATVGGILGIVSVPVSIIPFFGLAGGMLAIAAIVMGSISVKKAEKKRGWAIAAIVLGCLGILVCIAAFLVLYFFLFTA